MFNRFINGQFALGLSIGSGIALLALMFLIEPNYCPDPPCQQTTMSEKDPLSWIPFHSGPRSALGAEVFEDPEHKDYLSGRDLIAQENMARATNTIAVLTAISTLFGTLGAILLLWTLLETRKTTIAALENTQFMRQSHERELRAYLSLSKTEVSVDHGKVKIILKITNGGMTPAKDVIFSITSTWTSHPVDTAPKLNFGPVGTRTTLGHKETLIINSIRMAKPHSSATTVFEHGIAVAALISYRDVFGRLRKTLYCGFITAEELNDEKPMLSVSPKHNRIT